MGGLLEIGRAERLERMADQDLVFDGAGASLKPSIDDIQELAHQHRRRNLTVVPKTLPNIADVKVISGREQGFQKQIAILIAKRAVTLEGGVRHQVERQCTA
jgi:hypothetical protein